LVKLLSLNENEYIVGEIKVENVYLAKYGNCYSFFKYILDNLAYGKTTHESSTQDGHSPSYAVDGVIAALDESDPFVTHTQNSGKQYNLSITLKFNDCISF